MAIVFLILLLIFMTFSLVPLGVEKKKERRSSLFMQRCEYYIKEINSTASSQFVYLLYAAPYMVKIAKDPSVDYRGRIQSIYYEIEEINKQPEDLQGFKVIEFGRLPGLVKGFVVLMYKEKSGWWLHHLDSAYNYEL